MDDPNIINYLATIKDALGWTPTSQLARLSKSAYTCSHLDDAVDILRAKASEGRFVTTANETLCITDDSVVSFHFSDEPQHGDSTGYWEIVAKEAILPISDLKEREIRKLKFLRALNNEFREKGGLFNDFIRTTRRRWSLFTDFEKEVVKEMDRGKTFYAKLFQMFPHSRVNILTTPLAHGMQWAKPIVLGSVFEHCKRQRREHAQYEPRLSRRGSRGSSDVVDEGDTVTGRGWYCSSEDGFFSTGLHYYIVLEVEERGTGLKYGHYQEVHLAKPF